MRSKTVKRAVDVCGAAVGIAVLGPAMAATAIAVRWRLGAPAVFRQQRPGLNGKPFWMYKFRTMTDGRDANGELLPDSERLTPLGRFLRSSSLDELPELLNVLRGDMSLVGPRPLLMEYLQRYTSEQARRHEVPPGITGWAQINGRNALSWKDKFELDSWYVDNWDTKLDLLILWRTVWAVLTRQGISAAGSETMPQFMGSHESNE